MRLSCLITDNKFYNWLYYSFCNLWLKSVSMRKPGRRWYSSNHRFLSNLAQMLGLVSKWLWQKLRLKYFILFKLRGPPPKMALLSLIYAYLISCLWFSISTTRKVMWKWNPLDHVLLLLVSKHRYSFEPDNLISLRGSILSKVHIL